MWNRTFSSADYPSQRPAPWNYRTSPHGDPAPPPPPPYRTNKRPSPSSQEPDGRGGGGGEKEEQSYDGAVLSIFAGRTSLCGVTYIRESKHHVIRLIWLVIFLGMIGASTWQLVGVFKKYYSYPIKTEISLGFSPLDFPTVTLCNVNPLRRSMVYLDEDIEDFVEDIQYEFEALESVLQWEKRRKKREIKKRQAGSGNSTDSQDYGWYNYDFDGEYGDYGEVSEDAKLSNTFLALIGKADREILKIMGHQKELAILSCSYQGRDCSPKNFSTILSPDYGNCFQFNSPSQRSSPLRSRRSGSSSGLSLVLYVERADYLQGFTEGAGFQVSVDQFNSMALPKGGGISLSPGYETSVGLKFLNISRLGDAKESKESHWTCENGEQFQKDYGFNYTVQSCLDTCTDKNIGVYCGCMRPEFQDLYPIVNRSLPSCADSNARKECAVKVIANVTTGTIDCKCGHACIERTFTTRYSMMQWPNSGMWYKTLGLVCEAEGQYERYEGADEPDHCEYLLNITDPLERLLEMSGSFLRVNIYYESLNFETLEQSEDYPLEQFGADIGGTIGLWTGFCIFTALELVDLLIQTIVFFCYTRANNQGNSSNQPRQSRYQQDRHNDRYNSSSIDRQSAGYNDGYPAARSSSLNNNGHAAIHGRSSNPVYYE